MRIYEGEGKCPGCQKPGSESPRDAKDNICFKCIKTLRIGKLLEQDYSPKHYQHVNLTWYSLSLYDGRDENKFGQKYESVLYELMKAMDRPGIETQAETLHLGKASGTTAANHYIMRKEYGAIIKKLIEVITEQMSAYSELNESIKKEIEKVRKTERNKLFNDGVERGRALLIQLNEGTITLDDFNKPQIKY